MSAIKISENTTNILNCCFFTINLDFVTWNQISKCKKLNLSLTSSIYLVVLPIEMQRRFKQTNIYHTHFTLSEKKRPKGFKCSSCKNPFFQCVCYWNDLLRLMLFIPCYNCKTLLFKKVYSYFKIFWRLTTMLLLSLKIVFWKKSVFYALSPQ